MAWFLLRYTARRLFTRIVGDKWRKTGIRGMVSRTLAPVRKFLAEAREAYHADEQWKSRQIVGREVRARAAMDLEAAAIRETESWEYGTAVEEVPPDFAVSPMDVCRW